MNMELELDELVDLIEESMVKIAEYDEDEELERNVHDYVEELRTLIENATDDTDTYTVIRNDLMRLSEIDVRWMDALEYMI